MGLEINVVEKEAILLKHYIMQVLFEHTGMSDHWVSVMLGAALPCMNIIGYRYIVVDNDTTGKYYVIGDSSILF